MSSLKIGWAEESITPEQKINLAGQFFQRISEFVETPVTVTAMAAECRGEQMVICSCDLLSVEVSLIARVKGLLRDKVNGLPLDKIIINATHTHTSHVYQCEEADALSSLRVLERYLPQKKEYKEKISSDVMTGEAAFCYLA